MLPGRVMTLVQEEEDLQEPPVPDRPIPWGHTMNWNMIGALGEILGAVGVIVTLGYLAKQIRQSNVAARNEARREVLDLTNRFLGTLGGSSQVAQLWRRGLMADPDLSPDEWMQLAALFLLMTENWQRLFEFEHEFAGQDAVRREVVGSPGYRAWFAQRKHWLNPRIREVIEKEIANSPGWSPVGPVTSRTDA